ncbi:MAG: sporulation protein [Planctomycetales bacterium]|nr:sporulation protein [Planctomycetales bacterium]MCA9171156.1 sporulation protein [Planctomycetales bacterium]
MAACRVTIELDDPGKVYSDGDVVTGHVVVVSNKDVTCNGLIANTEWATHGRGNVDRGEVEQAELFRGEWSAGQTYRYPFQLPTAAWPPTYYGSYLNVSHLVKARAKLSWALDPEGKAEIRVTASDTAAQLEPPRNQQTAKAGWFLSAIIILILVGAVGMIVMTAVFWLPLVLIVLGIPMLIVWFVRTWLPRLYTGKVEIQLEPQPVRAGETLRGTVSFGSARRFSINEVRISIECIEQCVSGSGSNSTTHRTTVVTHEQQLLGQAELQAGESQSLEFEFAVPNHAPPSLDLRDNDVIWRAELTIDIPSWPDLKQRLDFAVVPSSTPDLSDNTMAEVMQSRSWLDEVLEQLSQSADDPERLRLVLDAIAENEFAVNLTVVNDYTEYEVPDPNDAWMEALDELSDVDFAVRFAAKSDVPAEGSSWRGTIRITGYLTEDSVVVAQALASP